LAGVARVKDVIDGGVARLNDIVDDRVARLNIVINSNSVSNAEGNDDG
jgi:hypothetical protein